jgi:hypothetical protein
MTDSTPDHPEWLRALVARSPLLPDPDVRRHWQRVIPWLSTAQRYELAATLLEVEQRVRRDTGA